MFLILLILKTSIFLVSLFFQALALPLFRQNQC